MPFEGCAWKQKIECCDRRPDRGCLAGDQPASQSTACATTVPTEVALTSAPEFTFSAGGTLSGTYTIPPFTGCGSATTLLNAFVAGPGNTVEIRLTQQGNAMSAAGSVSPMAPQSAK